MRLQTTKEFLTKEELAVKLGVSSRCVSLWMAGGRLFAVRKKGRRNLYSKYILLYKKRKPGSGRPRKGGVSCQAA